MSAGVLLVVVAAAAVAGRAAAWPRAASWAADGGSRTATAAPAPGDFDLLVLHNNDMHSRFEETDQRSDACSDTLRKEGRCYGGFARVSWAVEEARSAARDGRGPPVLFLNAGDTYQGTVWFIVHKWNVVSALLNKLRPDAASLGNHEFDNGPAGLAPFLEYAEFPVVAANIDVSSEPALNALGAKLRPSVVLDAGGSGGGGRRGRKVGVVGYLTPETANISFPGRVRFEDEVTAVGREARRLAESGVDIIIALGHSGFDVDQRIAEQVPEVDAVVGGHSNTFLYPNLAAAPDSEIPQGLYPTVVTQPSTGRRVPVVQAYAYTKYLGRLRLTFDAKGELKAFSGDPQLLNSSVPQAPAVLEELESWRGPVLAKQLLVVGRSAGSLNGSSLHCRAEECNLGSLIADAFVRHHLRRLSGRPAAGGGGWTDAAVALLNSGGIRASLGGPAGSSNVTMGDLMAVLPFGNTMHRCRVAGAVLRAALEHAVHRYSARPDAALRGEFLQLAGIRVTYDVTRPAGRRVRRALVLCANCSVPEYRPLQETAQYEVLLPSFLRDGYDGFGMLGALPGSSCQHFNYTDLDVIEEEFRLRSPVFAVLDHRIQFDPPLVELRARIASTTGGASPVSGLLLMTLAPTLLVSTPRL